VSCKAERKHLQRVAELGCIVCRNTGLGETPAHAHHINSKTMGRKSNDYETIPLCPAHHNGGAHGIAVHSGLETWERNFGTERQLLQQVREELGIA
jgi:hypothetical protein